VISGTPTTVTNAALYTVTGSNAGGSSTTRLQIEIKTKRIAPDDLSYFRQLGCLSRYADRRFPPMSSGGEISITACHRLCLRARRRCTDRGQFPALPRP